MGQALNARGDKTNRDSKEWDEYSHCRKCLGLGLEEERLLLEAVGQGGEETWRFREDGGHRIRLWPHGIRPGP